MSTIAYDSTGCRKDGAGRAEDFSFRALGHEIGALVDEKQAAYGNSFGQAGEILQTLYPNGIQPAQYDDALCIVRIIDKLFRIATNRDAFGESPYRDIAGYGLLGDANNRLKTGKGAGCGG